MDYGEKLVDIYAVKRVLSQIKKAARGEEPRWRTPEEWKAYRKEYEQRPEVKKRVAEGKQRERDRIKADPVAYAKYLEKNRQRSARLVALARKRLENPEVRAKVNAYQRKYMKEEYLPRLRETNPEAYKEFRRKANEASKRYWEKHPDKLRAKWERKNIRRYMRRYGLTWDEAEARLKKNKAYREERKMHT